MASKIRIGIVGYGNLGRGVQASIAQNEDMELVAVFTRRDPSQMPAEAGVKFEHVSTVEQYKGSIDVMILCGGSATDLPEQTPAIAALFNTVDSFDTHAKIPEFLQAWMQRLKTDKPSASFRPAGIRACSP